MSDRFKDRNYVSIDELKNTPLVPYDGMEFADDSFMPQKFLKGMYHVHLFFICKKVRKCTPILSAFKSQRISEETYYRWKRIYKEEQEKYKDTNYTTPMIMFFDAINEADSNNEEELAGVLFDTAINDLNTDSAKYLLDKRHKWKETKAVEVDTAEDKGIEINISAMKDSFNESDDEDEE